MKLYPLLVGVLAHLAAGATFAGKEDDFANFMANPANGRGPIFGNSVRKLASDTPGK